MKAETKLVDGAMPRIVFISELYHPYEVSTGYFLTGIAEGIAQERPDWSIKVLCAKPGASTVKSVVPKEEQRNGTTISRISSSWMKGASIPSRIWKLCSVTFRMGLLMLRKISKGDLVIVVTNPPSLSVLTGWVCRIKKAHPVILIHDLYPDVLVPMDLLTPGNPIYRMMDWFQRASLRRMRKIIVLGRDMRARVLGKGRIGADRLSIIPNWGELKPERLQYGEENPIRIKHGLTDKFVVQFSGNLGRTHGLDDLISLAKRFSGDSTVHFLVFGSGAGRDRLARQIEEYGLENMTLLAPCHPDELSVYLSAADLFFLPYKPGMEGLSVPSRMYNVMAAGIPILAACSSSAEVARVLEEAEIGEVVPPGEIDAMVKVIQRYKDNPGLLAECGKRAREVALETYTRRKVVAQYVNMIDEIMTGGSRAS